MTFRYRAIALFTGVVLILSACAAPEPTGDEVPETIKSAPETSSSKANDEMANLPPVAMLPPERALRDGLHGPDAPEPTRLIGLKANQIQKMFGTPDFKRHDHPAEIWQYRREGCLLDIFLYQSNGNHEDYRVNHVDARGKSIEEVSGTECLLEALAR